MQYGVLLELPVSSNSVRDQDHDNCNPSPDNFLAWAVQGDFLYTVLQVGFNESVKSATVIASLYTYVLSTFFNFVDKIRFSSVLTGIIIGLVIFRVRRLKPFILFGTCLFLIAFGVLIRYRGGSSSHAGMIGAQVLLGIAGGFFPYPAQASIQAAAKHERTLWCPCCLLSLSINIIQTSL